MKISIGRQKVQNYCKCRIGNKVNISTIDKVIECIINDENVRDLCAATIICDKCNKLKTCDGCIYSYFYNLNRS